ncbi:MAG: hypothetical protein M3121_07715 [Chloroflexota bacterium]|nr:hypothetical protein [Chloroflexota bacterium]
MATPLHLSPPSFPMASGDRAALGFSAGEARLVRLGTDPPGEVTDDLVADVDQGAEAGTVTVVGGERGATYELRVTFENAANAALSVTSYPARRHERSAQLGRCSLGHFASTNSTRLCSSADSVKDSFSSSGRPFITDRSLWAGPGVH